MKLKRAGIVTATVVCMAAVNVSGTFGLPEDGTESVQVLDQTPQDQPDGGALNGESQSKESKTAAEIPPAQNQPQENEAGGSQPEENQPEEGKPQPEDGKDNYHPEGNEPDNNRPEGNEPDSSHPEGNEPDNNRPEGNEPDSSQPEGNEPDNNRPEGNEPDSSHPEGNEPDNNRPEGNEPDSSHPEGNEPDNNQPGDNEPGDGQPEGNEPDGSLPEDVTPPQENQPEPEAPSNQPSQTNPNEESAAPGKDRVIVDKNAGAVYIQNVYSPSDLFIDNREKTKYNVALPIDGIPSFITQEMVIGALKCQDETGYPASVTIAQIIQESGFGVYGPGGENGQGLSYLAYQYNNLFGIKGSGSAGSVNMRTGEQTAFGENYVITAGFRAYHTYTEAIEDRAELLQEVYGDLTRGVTDANTFAMRIGSRWATDIRYSQSLIKQMETYDLYRLDKMTLKEFSDMIGEFADPCPGSSVTSTFGYREWSGSFHKGIDLGTGASNIPTYAVEAGTVIVAGWDDAAGNWIVIDHGNGLVTKYMHHDQLYVTAGQKVEKGQQIGLSGTTGRSTGNHLHFQAEENGTAVDPAAYLVKITGGLK